MQVDNYSVKGNATLFDGSVVETGQASAQLRLDKGTEITMAASSRGTLYRDHMVLQQGKSELTSSSTFQIKANGLHVTPSGTNAKGVVSLDSGNTVEVAALTGSFKVTNEQGILVASVHPGQPLSFAMQAGGSSTAFSGTGIVTAEGGHYYITVDAVLYEITGKDLSSEVGKTVTITGKIVTGATPDGGATAVVAFDHMKKLGSMGGGSMGGGGSHDFLIGSIVVGSGLAAGLSVNAVNSNPSTASVQ
jgi:hypothetical protein